MANKLRDLAVSHRNKLISVAAVVLLYAGLGFFLAPWLIKKNAIDAVQQAYGSELRIEHVAVNPLVLSLRIDGMEMDDPNGEPFVRLDQFYANFQLSSLFRWALTFAEIRFDTPELFIARDASGEFNLAFLSANRSTQVDANAGDEAGATRFVLQELAVNDAAAHWNDAVPREPVRTTFGPVNVQILDLSTLPENEGRQDVVIATETTGTFSWSGSLQLNPLRSAGQASIKGSHFPLLSAYIRDNAGFEVVRGDAGVELDYSIDTLDGGQIQARVDNFDVSFDDVLLRTFGLTASDGSNIDRDVLEIPRFRIDGGSLRYPDREAEIGSISIEDGVLGLYRNASGELNILHHEAPTEEAIDAVAIDDTSDGADWVVSLDRVDIERIEIELIDDSVSPTADIGIQSLDVSVTAISNAPDARFPLDVSISTRGGGSVKIDGEVGVLPALAADLDLTIEGIKLALLAPYVKSLADVSLELGDIGLNARLHIGPEETLSLSGDAAISNFLITETDEGSKLGSWDLLAANQFEFSLSKETLDVSEVRFDRPYGDILIAADGSVNLGRVAPGKQSAEEVTDEEEAEPSIDAAAAPPNEELPLAITIGRVLINDASADFADFSLPLPFDVKIAELNGTLTTIASQSSEPSEVTLEGKVDEFGLVQVSGTLTPLQIALNTDLKVHFENVAMPKFSAYSVPFAGREIASGKLDLFLGYRLEASELVGENKIVLRDFELGEKVDHPGATSLPLGLAVALLKNPDGSIDIDLPVRGNVDDPDFRYGRVVGKALVNLVVKIVASPFALLGKLIGVEADELEFIAFQDGRADLTPPEQEKAAKLAEALALRPELKIEIYGVIDRESDGLALRTSRLDALVEEKTAALSSDDSGNGSDAMYASQRAEVLEDFFDKNVLAEVRELYTTTEPEKVFDELAYTNALRSRLIEAQNLAETDFVDLAAARAANVKAAILMANTDLESQIGAGELQAIEKGSDETIRMKVVLASGRDNE